MTTKLVTLLVSAALAGGLAGCTARGHYRGTATVYANTAPDMAYVSPGVRVIADYDEPIFFADGYYWYNADGVWYRSGYYTGGWQYVTRPPTVIARIDRPYAYVRYRPHNYVVRNRPVPVNRIERPVVRDHRGRAARRGGYIYRR